MKFRIYELATAKIDRSLPIDLPNLDHAKGYALGIQQNKRTTIVITNSDTGDTLARYVDGAWIGQSDDSNKRT